MHDGSCLLWSSIVLLILMSNATAVLGVVGGAQCRHPKHGFEELAFAQQPPINIFHTLLILIVLKQVYVANRIRLTGSSLEENENLGCRHNINIRGLSIFALAPFISAHRAAGSPNLQIPASALWREVRIPTRRCYTLGVKIRTSSC